MRDPASKWTYFTTANFKLHLHHLRHTPINQSGAACQAARPMRETLSFISITCSTRQSTNQGAGRVSGSATNERPGPQMNPILRQQTLSFISITCSTPINPAGAASQAARPMIFLYSFYVRYSMLLHLPPLRFHWVGGCWDRAQDCCNFGIDSQTIWSVG